MTVDGWDGGREGRIEEMIESIKFYLSICVQKSGDEAFPSSPSSALSLSSPNTHHNLSTQLQHLGGRERVAGL